MPLVPPQGYLKITNLHRIGTAAARPAAADVVIGTLYFSTDTGVLERSNGAAWVAYTGAGSIGVVPVSQGGTGFSSLTTDRIPFGNGTSPFGSSADLTFDIDTSTFLINGPIDTSGIAGGQIEFPASQNASADAHTLDDYEEGTWTPTIGGSGGESGQVYSAQNGYYVKVGQNVMLNFRVALSTLGTITTNVQIKGLPFTSLNQTNYRGHATMAWANLTTAIFYMEGQIVANDVAMTVNATIAGGAVSLGALVQADLSATTVLAGTLMYRADA